MALSRSKLPKLRISRSMPRFQFRSSSVRTKPSSGTPETDQKLEFLSDAAASFGGSSSGLEDPYNVNGDGNKVMVVVGSGPEAKGALDWALSHTIQNQDTVVLLFVTKAPRRGVASRTSDLKTNLKAYEILHSMKNLCQNKKPGLRVEVVLQEAKEKGPAIVDEAKQQSASLLVLGQRKRPIIWRLVMRRWPIGKRSKRGSVDYCIQNASCMAIAVRRKGKRLGGHLITTKRHKNFWLLA